MKSSNPNLHGLNWRRLDGRILLLAMSLLSASVVDTASAAEPKESKREMLAKHQTVAQFQGVEYQQCRGLTSLCPDQCGGSGDFASFRILKYLAYEKPGQYGDPKQPQYRFQVQDFMKNLKVPAAIRDIVAALKKGDFVLLDWQHDYVTKDGSSSPERPIKKLEKITREEAVKLTGGIEELPAPAKPNPGVELR